METSYRWTGGVVGFVGAVASSNHYCQSKKVKRNKHYILSIMAHCMRSLSGSNLVSWLGVGLGGAVQLVGYDHDRRESNYTIPVEKEDASSFFKESDPFESLGSSGGYGWSRSQQEGCINGEAINGWRGSVVG
ncbi:hypothetical protein NC652_020696 [Populus alba x Populus x berolinensis]|nr:hypothetical protein NC652_020696 [Populus alba x Populus x berolinensis]